jgi:hypothetical protein
MNWLWWLIIAGVAAFVFFGGSLLGGTAAA